MSGYNQELQIWRSVVTAQIYLVFEKLLFLLFSHLFFQKKLDVKKLIELQFLNPIVGLLSGYIQGLHIWSLSMTAQYLFAFREMAFFMIF